MLEWLKNEGEKALRLHRLPVPTEEEGGEPLLRHTLSREALRRMYWRVQRALLRLGLQRGDALAVEPLANVEYLMVWAAAAEAGMTPMLLAPDAPLPAQARVCICPPQARKRRTAQGGKVATLGGLFEGSFFMLQMAQPATSPEIMEKAPASTLFVAGDGDMRSLEFAVLLRAAGKMRRKSAVRDADALAVALAHLATPCSLLASLAALMTAGTVYWLDSTERARAMRQLADLDAGRLLILSDAPEKLRREAAMPEGWGVVDVHALCALAE